jgi:hypothetical protein
VQTFLPFPDFPESAHVLDQARLGKQRVEALQVLRAIVLPSYGWQTHPAMQMWRGYVPALTRYSLAMVDAWTDQGHPDTTRPLITEFAPEAATDIPLALPSWLGNDALHLSHRSNLVRKAPEIYAPLFPGVPDNLPYVWPGADPIAVRNSGGISPGVSDGMVDVAGASPTPQSEPVLEPVLQILRPRTAAEFDEWIARSEVVLREVSPRGGRAPKWRAQLEAFSALEAGTPVAVLTVEGDRLVRGTVTGPASRYEEASGEVLFRMPVEFRGELPRQAFGYPALLQDPRSLFPVPWVES